MLRRILVVWSLLHPHFSYRQGMHELLAPLLYVLHRDVVHLSEMKHRHKDLFDDRFDEPSLLEPQVLENGVKQTGQSFRLDMAILTTGGSSIKNEAELLERIAPQDSSLLDPDEFGYDLGIMVLGSDRYGAEGELGALLSGRFVEHDAYSMFDALMSGKGGAIHMADYFLTATGPTTGFSPVLQASGTLYRALAAADLSLYNHLLGLGVEPQFFSLRWLRVLFGREFDLGKLLLLWDAIFSVANISESLAGMEWDNSSSQPSPRRAFILALAVSMLLYLRPTLLAAPSATECLQKLLNFPQSADVRPLIDRATILKHLVEEVARILPSRAGQYIYTDETGKFRKPLHSRNSSPYLHAHAVSSTNKLFQRWNASREILSRPLSESYWEEKWRSSILEKGVPGNVKEATLKTSGVVSPVSVQDLAANSIASKVKGKGSLLVADAHAGAGSGSEHMLDNISKTVERKLPSGLSEAAVSHLHSDVNIEGIDVNSYLEHRDNPSSGSTGSYCIRQTLQEASMSSQDSNEFQEICKLVLCGDLKLKDGSFKGRADPDKRTLSPDNSYQEKLKALLSDNGNPSLVTDPGMTSTSALAPCTPKEDTSCETVRGTLSTKFLLCEKVSGGKAAEKSGPAHAVLNEDVLIDMNSKVHCSTQLVRRESEGSEGTSEMSLSVPKLSISPTGSQPQKKFWIWNRRKTDRGDKISGSAQLQDGEKKSNIAVTPENSCTDKLVESEKELLASKGVVEDGDSVFRNTAVRELCSSTCSSSPGTQTDGNWNVCLQAGLSEFIPKNRSAKDGLFANLRSLGQSISDNIQVIETALSLVATHGSNESLLVVSGEKLGKVLTGGMGHKAAETALAELRKASDTLLHM